MVASAVLGAATGTGMALFVGVTIVVYRYYALKKRAKEWGSLDRMAFPDPILQKRSLKSVYAVTQKDFNVAKEHHIIQPPQNSSSQAVTAELMKTPLDVCSNSNSYGSPHLQHQSKSYPGGQPLLCRTPSVSSQSSLDSGASRQGHRGSSPQIRTFAPDGRTTTLQHQEAAHSSSYPLRNASRSPSPLRAASLDIRCSSPGASVLSGELRTPSPSQSSLTSLTGGSVSSTCNSPAPASPRTAGLGRCLSPLLIPSRGHTPDVGAPQPPASPLGAIQPDLYTRQDGPLFIGGSPKYGPSLGRLHFRLKYDFDKSDMVVHLIEGINDYHPYSTQCCNVIPTLTLSLTLIQGPEIDLRSLFVHDVTRNVPLLQSLRVFDYDRFSRNDVVGEVRMSMDEFDVTSSIEVWGEITKNKKPPEELQEVLLSLSYLPSAERLTVVLLKARNLFLPQDKDNIDPFVKVYLVVNGKRVKKKKSAARKGTINPVWNEALTFSLSSCNLNNAAIEVCIMDQGNDLIGTNPLIGGCLIGPKESGAEKDHWIDMTQSPRKAVACWHTLR
ncbi:synaptotagmin [Holotrichia oblita]|uniref:Synaptotagmin n=1 Tax=Holotrichia oblita TaxID=644536 RepID=A0ACB9T9L3_HOLOL|nr:synaptotagmin [Holotrichia oblita]